MPIAPVDAPCPTYRTQGLWLSTGIGFRPTHFAFSRVQEIPAVALW